MNGRTARRVLWPGFGLIVVAAIGLAALEIYEGFANAPELRRDREWIEHTAEVRSTMQTLGEEIQRAIIGERGFLITGDAAYLEPYSAALRDIPQQLEKLRRLTVDNPEQQRRISILQSRLTALNAMLAETIETRQSQGLEAVIPVVRTNRAVDDLQAVTELIDSAIATEDALMSERVARSAADERTIQTIALIGAALALSIMTFGGFTAWRALEGLRRAETARRQFEDQFTLLVSGTTDYAMYTLDTKGRITSWNPGAERIKGYTAAEIMGQDFSVFYTEEDRAAGLPKRALDIATREGKYEAERWRVRKDGSRFMAAVSLRPLRDPAGRHIGFAKITRDITERVEQQNVIERTRAALVQSQKMDALGQLTGGIAHDFNNLLHIMMGSIDLLRRQLPADAEMRRYADAIARGAERAQSLTQRLLAFTRRQPLDPKPVDANKLVLGMSDLLHRTLGESIAIETVLSAGLWWASADVNQLESAIVNLAVNARDAMRRGGKLTIETSNAYLDDAYAAAHSEVMPGQYVMIAVSDTGTGMSSDTVAKAFEPFFTTKEPGQGTGLGLSQVFGFIKQSGGHVKIYSELGAGATVKLYLPRLAEAAVLDLPTAAPAAPLDTGTETILVVEDEDDVRAFTAEMLRDLGYRILTARDGHAALRVLDQEPGIDLLLSDVGLPGGMNGRPLADEALRRRPALKVVFTTGYARNAIIHHGRLDPGVELILKPFTQHDVAAKLRRVLGR